LRALRETLRVAVGCALAVVTHVLDGPARAQHGLAREDPAAAEGLVRVAGQRLRVPLVPGHAARRARAVRRDATAIVRDLIGRGEAVFARQGLAARDVALQHHGGQVAVPDALPPLRKCSTGEHVAVGATCEAPLAEHHVIAVVLDALRRGHRVGADLRRARRRRARQGACGRALVGGGGAGVAVGAGDRARLPRHQRRARGVHVKIRGEVCATGDALGARLRHAGRGPSREAARRHAGVEGHVALDGPAVRAAHDARL